MTEYTLSKSILTDGEAVRSLTYISKAFLTDGEAVRSHTYSESSLLSGSEGGVITSTDLKSFETDIQTQTKHGHQVTALTTITPCTSDTSGGYVTGCKDSLIRVFNKQHELIATLRGHEKAVTSLSWLTLNCGDDITPPPILISGSWDGTAKIWNINTGLCLATLEGHENTVSVQGLPPPSSSPMEDDSGTSANTFMGRLVTGSAGVAQGNLIKDHKIRIFNICVSNNFTKATHQITNTVANDHNGPIRGLAFDPLTAMIFSCSNDGTVKIRDGHTGECVITVSTPANTAQPPMLLDVVSLDGGKIASCSEDGNVFIWDVSSGKTDQVQTISHPNCVWRVSTLPNGDLVTACADTMIRIFTLDSERFASPEDIAALNDAVTESRAKSSSGPSAEEIAGLPKWEEQTAHVGRSDGQVQVFNKGGKAIAAQWSATSGTWIEVGEVTGRNDSTGTVDGVRYDHVFPIEVDVPGGGVQNLQIGYNNGENPFTTAQTFIDEHMLDQGYLAQIADYIRQRVGQGSVPTLGVEDASGGGEVTSGPIPMQVEEPPMSFKHLPMVGFKSFDAGAESRTLKKVLDKIREFNSINEVLTAGDFEILDGLATTLSATNRYHASSVSDSEMKIIQKLIEKSSLEHVFPALDLARLLAMHPDASKSGRTMYWDNIVKLASMKCHSINGSGLQGTPTVAIPMLSLRLFSNCFKGGSGSTSAVKSNFSAIFQCVQDFALSSSKNIRLAVSTVILNVSSYAHSTGSFTAISPDVVLSLVGSIVGSGTYEAEALARALVGLGTILLVDDVFKQKAKELEMKSMVERVGTEHGNKVTAVALEIQQILK